MISSAGVETIPHDIEILSGEVRILEALPSYIVPGKRMAIVGQNFRTDEPPRVTVAGITATEPKVQPGGQTLTFTVPKKLPKSTAATAQVIISFPNREDAIQTLPLRAPDS